MKRAFSVKPLVVHRSEGAGTGGQSWLSRTAGVVDPWLSDSRVAPEPRLLTVEMVRVTVSGFQIVAPFPGCNAGLNPENVGLHNLSCRLLFARSSHPKNMTFYEPCANT